ncbi:MAG TPA: branched-chain amino acid ABC transporter permease [Herpetosiphonaceae bacterium]
MTRLKPLLPLLVLLGLAGLPFAFAEETTRFWQGVLIQIYILAVYALSYDLLMGYTGMISFGHALFLGGGAYTTAIMLRGEQPPSILLVILAVIVVGLALGALVGALSLRLSGVYFSMITLAIAEIVFILFRADDPKLKPITGGELGLQGVQVPAMIDPTTFRLRFYFLALAFAAALYFVARRIVSSPTGRVFVAIRENERRAQALGYNTFVYKLLATMLSAMLASLAGMMLVLYDKSATFEILSVNMTIQALLMTIIGGIGTLIGPMLGAATIRLLDQWLESGWLHTLLPGWLRTDLLFGLIYISLVLFFPAGIVGAFNRLRGRPGVRWFEQIRRSLSPSRAKTKKRYNMEER